MDFLLPIIIPYLLIPFDELLYCSCRLVNRQCSVLIRQLCHEAALLVKLTNSRDLCHLPPFLTTLFVAPPATSFLDVQLLPTSLEHLYLSDSYSQPLIFRSLPASLQTLVCGEKVKYDFHASQLPRTLKTFVMKRRRDKFEPDWRGLPDLFILKAPVVPSTLRAVDLPTSLLSLTISSLPSLQGLPPSLTELVCKDFSTKVVLAHLPQGLKILDICTSFGFLTFSFAEMPPTLEVFKCHGSRCPGGSRIVLPKTLKEMYFGAILNCREIVYPENLETLYCYVHLSMKIPMNLRNLTLIGDDDNYYNDDKNITLVEDYLLHGVIPPQSSDDLSRVQEEFLLNHHLRHLPSTLTYLDVSSRNLEQFTCPPLLEHLALGMNTHCPYPLPFPPTLRYLESWSRETLDLLTLPSALETLECHGPVTNLPALNSHLPNLIKLEIKQLDCYQGLPSSLRELRVQELEIPCPCELPRHLEKLCYYPQEKQRREILERLPRTLKFFASKFNGKETYSFEHLPLLRDLYSCDDPGRTSFQENKGDQWIHPYNLATRTSRWQKFLQRLEQIHPAIKKSNFYLCWSHCSSVNYATVDILREEMEIIEKYCSSFISPPEEVPLRSRKPKKFVCSYSSELPPSE